MFLNPQEVLNALDLRPGLTVADFGCGAGFYSLIAAKKTGSSGKVYAIDIRKEMLEMVKSKARQQHLLNIYAVLADLETLNSTKIKEMSVDIVLISNILFQVADKNAVLQEARRVLKPAGQIMAVEWDITETPAGPPLKYRITKKETERLFIEAGFSFHKEFSAGSHHYGLIFKKE